MTTSYQSIFQSKCLRLQRQDATLSCLDLAVTNDEDAFCFSQALQGNNHLLTATLQFGGTLSDQGAQAIITGMAQSNLSQLALDGCNLPNAVKRQLILGFSSLHKLRHLDFLDDWKVEEFDIILATMVSLQSLSLNDSRCFATIEKLGRGLAQTTSLQALTMSKCTLTSAYVLLICGGLRCNTSITKLDCYNCRLNDEAVNTFCRNWSYDSGIQHLNLTFNLITPAGVRILLETIPLHPALQTLNLNNNMCIGYEGLYMIGNALPHLQLRHLHLRECLKPRQHHADAASREQALALENKARHMAANALVTGITSNVHLHVLDVAYNRFSSEVEENILFCTLRNQFLLYMDMNLLPPTVWCHILAKCRGEKNPHNLVFFFLREHPDFVPQHQPPRHHQN